MAQKRKILRNSSINIKSGGLAENMRQWWLGILCFGLLCIPLSEEFRYSDLVRNAMFILVNI